MFVDLKNKLMKIGYNKEVIECLVEVYEECKDQCRLLVEPLASLSYYEQMASIWCYFIDNVNYQLDPGDNQFLKTPGRLLYDGVGDCKSYSLFFASCLYCLGIPFVFRFVSFTPSKDFQHVYVVACPGTNHQIILDAVEKDTYGQPVYNYARDFIYKKDIAG